MTVSTSSSVQYAAPAGCAGSAELEGNSSCAGRSTSIGSSSTVPSHLDLILEKTFGVWHAQFIFHNLCTKPLL